MAFEIKNIKKEIDILGFNSLYYFEFNKNFYHSEESHPFWELVYVDSGKINAISNGIGVSLSQGQVIFHKPSEMHSHISNKIDPSNLLVVAFTCESKAMDFFDGKIFTLGKSEKKILSLFLDEAKDATKKLSGSFEDKTPIDFSDAAFGSVQLMGAMLEELLISLIRRSDENTFKIKPGRESKKIVENSLAETINEYLSENIYGNITLEKICGEFNISKSYLCKIFKENYGRGTIDCYLNLKIAEAKKLIRTEKYTISQISDMLMFSCIHHFSRSFKRFTGVTPTEYKKRL